MKGVIAFDSVHGNTKLVAEAIAEQIKAEGHEVQLINVRGSVPASVSGDFLLIGSPTRGSRATKEAMSFVEALDSSWKGKPIAVFDTVGPLSKDAEKRKKWLETIDAGTKNAASKLKDRCIERGMSVSSVLHVPVVGMMGPLAPEGTQMGRDFAHKFIASLK
ncbi:MAG: flavodoxin domain-containing protein [Methanomassiliicoccales archaeon]|nr:flavodoxin domain-containing protein [Methanomassiliicoccales archaeon]